MKVKHDGVLTLTDEVEGLDLLWRSAEKGARRRRGGRKASWVYYVKWANPSFTEAVRDIRGWGVASGWKESKPASLRNTGDSHPVQATVIQDPAFQGHFWDSVSMPGIQPRFVCGGFIWKCDPGRRRGGPREINTRREGSQYKALWSL